MKSIALPFEFNNDLSARLFIWRSARWIGNHGFSIGIDDVQPGEDLNEKKGKTIEKGYWVCDGLILDYNEGKLRPQPGCDAAQTLEAKISGTLNKIREETANVRAFFLCGNICPLSINCELT